MKRPLNLSFRLPQRLRLQTLRRALIRPVPQILLLLVFLGLFGISVAQVRSYESDVMRQSFTLNGQIPVPVLRFAPTRASLNVIAVLAHGYSANKEIMSGFAVDLAKQGMTVYAFDFPGHGASTVPYGGGQNGDGTVSKLVASLGEVVDYATAHATTPNPKIVLIGYSLGTIAVGEYALQHPNQPNLQATVLVAGILQDRLTSTTPRNLLVLSGQFDLPGINDTARRLMASGCGVPLARVAEIYSCNLSTPYPRSRIVLPGLDHISIVTAASTHAAVLHWLGATVDPRIGAVQVNADVRIHWLLIGMLAALLAVLPLVSLGAAALGVTRPQSFQLAAEDGKNPRIWRGIALVAGALLAALVAIRLLLPSDFWAPEPFPFGFLNQQVSADVALFFLIAGGLLLVARRFLLPKWTPPTQIRLREVAPQLLLAIAITAFLFFTLGKLSSFAWESLMLSPTRLWHAMIYAVMVWPFFGGVQSLLGAAHRTSGRALLFDANATLLVVASLVAAIVMNFARLSYLGILLPVVAIVLFVFLGLNAWMRRIAPNPTALISTTQALALGWILAATLPLIN